MPSCLSKDQMKSRVRLHATSSKRQSMRKSLNERPSFIIREIKLILREGQFGSLLRQKNTVSDFKLFQIRIKIGFEIWNLEPFAFCDQIWSLFLLKLVPKASRPKIRIWNCFKSGSEIVIEIYFLSFSWKFNRPYKGEKRGK